METWTHRFADTNGIRMHYVEQGEGFPVVLCHGFPELWYSWRYQIPALAAGGLRAIAPDLRGYGETGKPPEIEAYDIHHLTADIVGLLDSLGLEKAVVVGHDWGGLIVWPLAQMYPERVERVVGLNTPFLPRAPLPPTQIFRHMPDHRFDYILFFQEPGRAEAALEADLEGRLGDMIRRIAFDPDFLSDEDLRNYYRNIDRNWETTAELSGKQVLCPSLIVSGVNDPILKPEMADGMEAHVPNLRRVLVEDCGHWIQQEKPAEVNAALLEFLADLTHR